MASLKSYNQHRRGHVHKGAPHTSSTRSSTQLFPAHFTLTSMVAITITNPSVTLLKAKSATLWHVDDESRYEYYKGGRHPPFVLYTTGSNQTARDAANGRGQEAWILNVKTCCLATFKMALVETDRRDCWCNGVRWFAQRVHTICTCKGPLRSLSFCRVYPEQGKHGLLLLGQRGVI